MTTNGSLTSLRYAVFAMQTSVSSERAERGAAKPSIGNIISGSDDAHDKQHAEEDGYIDDGFNGAQHSRPSPTGTQHGNLQPASESKATEQQSVIDKLTGVGANGISEQVHQASMSQETEVLENSSGGREDECRFTKGAYFIGKAVWGKVSRCSRSSHAVASAMKKFLEIF